MPGAPAVVRVPLGPTVNQAPRPPIDAALAAGKRVLLEIDLQGARNVRAAVPSAVLVFLLPPSWEELVRRLTGRGTEEPAEQARRLETARVELAAFRLQTWCDLAPALRV